MNWIIFNIMQINDVQLLKQSITNTLKMYFKYFPTSA